MGDITIAGEPVDDPFERLAAYASRYSRTLRLYDLAAQGDPNVLTAEEVERTRVIASRISHRERDWFVERAEGAPWTALAPDADLADADPDADDGVYVRANALFEFFRTDAPRGVNLAKTSKVLHLKRPSLIPLLDSHLERRYRRLARQAALRHPAYGHRRMYWAAIRDDLALNRESIAALKQKCAAHEREEVQQVSRLTDLRVMDILTW